MRIRDILTGKGTCVVTVSPADTVTALLAALAEGNVGAAVVLDGARLAGIVSERDVVRALHGEGPDALAAPVSSIMTTMVASCRPDDLVETLSVTMTEKRIRHVPVLDGDGALAGIVSIGDVVTRDYLRAELRAFLEELDEDAEDRERGRPDKRPDKPRTDRPRGEKARGDRSREGKPRADGKPRTDKAREQRPERPRTEKGAPS